MGIKLDEIKDPKLRERIQAAMRQPMGGLAHTEPEQGKIPALACGSSKQKRRKKGVVECIVSIVSYRSRLLDDDNLQGGAKPLRDAIAETLHIDDGDPRIRFEYDQIETRGSTGTQVLITEL